jgi:hypothetical protein
MLRRCLTTLARHRRGNQDFVEQVPEQLQVVEMSEDANRRRVGDYDPH